VDTEIKELKELIRNQSALIEETNHMVRKMRSASRWSIVFQLVWWISVIGISGALYFVFVAPYVGQFMEVWSNAQQILSNFRPGQ
jgi:hypothetical protein